VLECPIASGYSVFIKEYDDTSSLFIVIVWLIYLASFRDFTSIVVSPNRVDIPKARFGLVYPFLRKPLLPMQLN